MTARQMALAIAVILGLPGSMQTAHAQSEPVKSPFLDEFLHRFVDRIRRGDPIDLTGLGKADTLYDATSYRAGDGSFGATVTEKGGDVEVMSIANVDENSASASRRDQTNVRMTRQELDAFVAAVRQLPSAMEGVEPAARCPDWPVPGTSENVLLQDVFAFQAADGRPAVLQVSASNLISPEAAGTLKPVWFVVLVLQTGKEWRCPA